MNAVRGLASVVVGGLCSIALALDVAGQTFTVQNIGSGSGALTNVTGGYDVTATGAGIQGSSDQFTFAYEQRTGDFDLEIRLSELGSTQLWAQAGLMARETLAVNARFCAALATPGQAGCQFVSRAAGSAQSSGWFPANYPGAWLRLRRAGNVFTGFASFDGQNWDVLGSANIALPTNMLVGLALASGVTNAATIARFRDFANGSGVTNLNQSLPFEPPGPSTRRTALTFTEIMYNPPDAWATNNLQYVELYNSGTVPEDLTGNRLAGDVDFDFPPGTTLAPGQFLLIAKNPAAMTAFFGVSALGPFSGNLPNSGGTLRLVSEVGARLLEVEFDSKWPWPPAADGAGHSLVLVRPSYGENNPQAWAASDTVGGSPGRGESYGADPARSVVINEFLAHTDLPQVDFVELYNHGNAAVDLSGCFLSDRVDTNRFQFPTNSMIPARGFLMLDENELGFRLNAAGGKIVLRNAGLTRVLDAVNYDAQENGIAFGRWPDGANRWTRLAQPTGGATNAPVRIEEVVLNELMYDPISGNDLDQYIEVHNASAAPVDLGGWRIKDGVDFTFPTNTTLSAGGFMVVAKDMTRLLTLYPQLNATNTRGNFSGKLSGKGERIELAKPDIIISTNDLGQISTNLVSIVVDEFTYVKGGRWPRFANRGGSSLELVDPRADRRLPSNWADSDESQKAPWTVLSVTNAVENGSSLPTRFEFFLQDDGEVLVDNVELVGSTGTNRVGNSGFESGLTGFTLNGTHRTSFVENGVGVSGSRALHLIASGRGDPGPNKVWATVTAISTTPGSTGIIRAQVRWLKGTRFIMFRTYGHWLELAAPLNVPTNPGTPGLVNSRRVANAGPAIYEVSHAPILPAALQPVVVTARVHDPNGVSSVTLSYRVDPGASLTSISMQDNGTNGDAVARDGVYSATISGQSSNTLVAFRITAVDGAAPGVTNLFPSDAPKRECLVRWGESVVPGTLGTYRVWITEATRSAWASRERNANDPLDCTFVYGNSRVIYNAKTLYSGSPFHTQSVGYNGPTGVTCDYELNFQPDEKFLGAESFVLSAIDVNLAGTFFPDPSAQVEITGNWIMRKLGQPSNHKRHVYLVVNGVRRGTIYEDSQQPNAEYVEEYFPNDEHGYLRKIEDWFEFDSSGSSFSYTTATIEQFFKASGGIDTKRYRWNWRERATDDPNDWSGFTNLVQAMNISGAGPSYVNAVLAQTDVRRWLGPVAVHHLCGDWDSYGYERGKNSFAYRNDQGKWMTLLWDIELCLGDSQSRPATDYIFSCHDSVLLKMLLSVGVTSREYLTLLFDAVNGPFAPGAADALLDARYAALQRNGVPVASPSFIKTFIASRRAYVLTQIPAPAFQVFSLTTSAVPTINFIGQAPIGVRSIFANGQQLSPTWGNATSWSSPFVLQSGSNLVSIVAFDIAGNIVAQTNLTIYFTGSVSWPSLRINEWMASNTGSLLDPADNDADDWFEIYNPNPTNVLLANWSLTDTPTNLNRYVIPAGYSVPAGGYRLVWADDETHQNTNTRPELHVNFKLDKDGDTIALYAPDGTLVDMVTFGAQTNNVSQGRWPSGMDFFEMFPQPTPGQANVGITPILAVHLNPGEVQLSFNTKPGSSYAVEWTPSLESPAWTQVQSAVVATNTTLTIVDVNPGSQRRFYRAVLLPE